MCPISMLLCWNMPSLEWTLMWPSQQISHPPCASICWNIGALKVCKLQEWFKVSLQRRLCHACVLIWGGFFFVSPIPLPELPIKKTAYKKELQLSWEGVFFPHTKSSMLPAIWQKISNSHYKIADLSPDFSVIRSCFLSAINGFKPIGMLLNVPEANNAWRRWIMHFVFLMTCVAVTCGWSRLEQVYPKQTGQSPCLMESRQIAKRI